MTEDTVSEITYTNNITVEEYNKLRKSVDWILVTEKRAAIALGNTFYLCVAMVGEEPVGMVRVVSDGGKTAIGKVLRKKAPQGMTATGKVP